MTPHDFANLATWVLLIVPAWLAFMCALVRHRKGGEIDLGDHMVLFLAAVCWPVVTAVWGLVLVARAFERLARWLDA